MMREWLNLLYQMTRTAYLSEEKNSVLGILWHLLRPLAMTAVLWVVFSNFSMFGEVDRYPLFILAGLVPFSFFSTATARGGTALVRGRGFILDTTLPREILVLQAVLLDAIDYAVELALLLLLIAVAGGGLQWSVITYVPVALALFLLVCGASLLLSVLTVFLRDLAHLWRVCMRMLFFATPIFYSLDMIDVSPASTIIRSNPLTWMAELGRGALLHGEPVPLDAAVALVAGSLVVLGVGLWVFRSLEHAVPERA